MKAETRPLRILDFDIETRKIGFHDAGRFAPSGCEPVAVAFKWVGTNDPVVCRYMGEKWTETAYARLLADLFKAIREADLVTGHYIRKFDLPILSGAAFELGAPFPSSIKTHDTKSDFINVAGFSLSQENVARMRKLERDKFHMSDNDWRAVARLTPDGIDRAVERVIDDVKQHELLYADLKEQGALHSPERWYR